MNAVHPMGMKSMEAFIPIYSAGTTGGRLSPPHGSPGRCWPDKSDEEMRVYLSVPLIRSAEVKVQRPVELRGGAAKMPFEYPPPDLAL